MKGSGVISALSKVKTMLALMFVVFLTWFLFSYGETQQKNRKCKGEWENWNDIPFNGCYLTEGECKGHCARGQVWINRCRSYSRATCTKVSGQEIFVNGHIADCMHGAVSCVCNNDTWRPWNNRAVGDGCE